ncbi:MAG: DUF2085 domain-containing protein [Bacteroidales bacterium]|nr:DUF2085 domain-containing protein [Bacteroidales bacterium]
MKRRVNWGMVLSHHPPCQYNRTFTLCRVRFCVRCTGILAGILLWAIVFSVKDLPFYLTFITGFLFPLPAILNFTLNELGKRKNSNSKRTITGILMGLAIGMAIGFFITNRFWPGIAIIAWIILLEFAVALVLRQAGVLDKFIREYEDAVYKD